jgi:hypothetical protein
MKSMKAIGGRVATANAQDTLSGSRLVQTWQRDKQGRLRGEWRLIAEDVEPAGLVDHDLKRRERFAA